MITLSDGRRELYQWDTGRSVQVDIDCDQIHFSNTKYTRSIDVDVVNGEAKIPDELLQADGELYAWCFGGSYKDGYTKHEQTFAIKKRPKPAGYVFTPTEQITLEKILEEIKDLHPELTEEDIKKIKDDILTEFESAIPTKIYFLDESKEIKIVYPNGEESFTEDFWDVKEIVSTGNYKAYWVGSLPRDEYVSFDFPNLCIELTAVSNDELSIYFCGIANSQYSIDGRYYTADAFTGAHYKYPFFDFKKLYVDEPTYYPCLVEGTPINMADGTVKPIEEVKAGDIILSYDPVADVQTGAVVVDAYVTGKARKFSNYSFSDGRFLTVYGEHGIYNKRTGTTKDIQKSNRNDQVINIDGDIVQWSATREMYYHGEMKRRYNLISSNNLYFANGILLGHKPFAKIQHIIDTKTKVDDAIRVVWEQDCSDYNRYNAFLDTETFHKDVAEINQKRARAEHIIAVNKKRLSDSDYKAQKQVEGLITEEEWAEAKEKRALWRKEINDNENDLAENKREYDAVVEKHRKGITPRKLFEECCIRDNSIFKAVKDYYSHE